jgi:hypothetical protein
MGNDFTLHEIIDNYGPVLASDADFGLLVSVNGSYFQVWIATGRGTYEVIEAYDFSSRIESKDGAHGADFHKVWTKAEEILQMHVEGED